MSIAAIRAALETRLDAISPALATAWENTNYVPDKVTPYQKVNLLFADPDNPVQDGGYREQGIFQVTLFYPIGDGAKNAAARAILIRDQFAKGLSLTNSGVTVTINKTPSISGGTIDGDRWSVPVKISWHANMM